MRVQDIHQGYFRTSVALSQMQVKNMISPLDVIRILNAEGVKFVLVGAHGIAGWLKTPRATQDVDVVVLNKHVKKATRVLLDAFPTLQASDEEVVVRLRDPKSGTVLIDLMKPRETLSGDVQTHAGGVRRKANVLHPLAGDGSGDEVCCHDQSEPADGEDPPGRA